MEIGLTETVRKMASAGALPAAQEGELLFCWDLARVDFGQRKLLVALNAATAPSPGWPRPTGSASTRWPSG